MKRQPWVLRRPPPRIFDAFLFAGELELLETRLHVLSSVVDTFVIVESDVAHSVSYESSVHRSPLYALLSVVLSVTASRVVGVKLASTASNTLGGMADALLQLCSATPSFIHSSVHCTRTWTIYGL